MKFYARFGLQIALAVIAFTLALYFTGLANSTGPGRFIGVLAVIFPIGGIAWGLRAWREQIGGGFMTFGRGIQVGVFIAMWWAVPATLFSVLYTKVINPQVIDATVAAQIAKFEASGASPQMVEFMRQMFDVMFHPVVQIVTGIFGSMFWGVLVALIATAILKRDPPPELAEPPPMPGGA